jgi:hypothetical protein
MKTIGYARVSTDKQADRGVSLEAQGELSASVYADDPVVLLGGPFGETPANLGKQV